MGGRQDAGDIGAETEKSRLAEGDLAGKAEQQIEADGQHGIDADEHQDIEQVPALDKQSGSEQDNEQQRADI